MAANMKRYISLKMSNFFLKFIASKKVTSTKFALPIKYSDQSYVLKNNQNARASIFAQYVNTHRQQTKINNHHSHSVYAYGGNQRSAIPVSTNTIYRQFSNESGNDNGKKNEALPLRLMDFTERMWPNPLKTLKNLFLAVLIRVYMDKHFTPAVFLKGAEQVCILGTDH